MNEKTDLCYFCKKQKPVDELICRHIVPAEGQKLIVFDCEDCRGKWIEMQFGVLINEIRDIKSLEP